MTQVGMYPYIFYKYLLVGYRNNAKNVPIAEKGRYF